MDIAQELRHTANDHSEAVLISGYRLEEAADEIIALRSEVQRLTGLLMSPWVYVHERIVAEVDEALRPHLGGEPELNDINGRIIAARSRVEGTQGNPTADCSAVD